MSYDIDKDFAWFKANRADLFRQYPGQFLVIRNQEVLGAYDDDLAAIESTQLPLGEYLLQECLASPDAYVERVYTPNLVMA